MEGPHPLWVWVAEVGFVGYVASLFLLIWRGFDGEGRWRGRSGWWWLLGALVSFALLVQGLLRA